MVKSYGYRHATRTLFAKKFRRHGVPSTRPYLVPIKMGDYVDVVADSSIREGMPHRYYHGKTGIVWNVTPRGVGVILNKRCGKNILRKRICVRVEHVRLSKCGVGFKQRVKDINEARSKGVRGAALKRQPEGPRPGYIVQTKRKAVLVSPQPYNFVQARKL